ncbi:MAG TPA: carboxypeptidase-like regulatory domain-containing protein, partial [Terriglobales bacterium]|nr:carboxypeptidase-like regulatory domain-containing protein [Terriglobales bacterium]
MSKALAGCFIMLCLFPGSFLNAQVSSALSGVVLDTTGAVIPGAEVTATNTETNAAVTVTTNFEGRFRFVSLAVGDYSLRISKSGFREAVLPNVRLVVGQEATTAITLQVGEIRQDLIEIVDPVRLISLTQDISGLVDERAVKDLPLNGRSYDLLLPLNPGVVNFTSEKTGGAGVSNSTSGNNFAVSGNRPQQNLFLLNGVEFTGAAENNMQPGGASQQLLGVEAVREFNVLRDSYGAQFGKHPGAQVLIATQSGTNRLHGSLYEFLRNSALDAPNYLDPGSAPPFERNQFGAAAGGPLRQDSTFLFVNYEGLRQRLNQTAATFVPDQASRAAAAAAV